MVDSMILKVFSSLNDSTILYYILFQYNLTVITHVSDILDWHNSCLIA